jgi:hypothetical protein
MGMIVVTSSLLLSSDISDVDGTSPAAVYWEDACNLMTTKKERKRKKERKEERKEGIKKYFLSSSSFFSEHTDWMLVYQLLHLHHHVVADLSCTTCVHWRETQMNATMMKTWTMVFADCAPSTAGKRRGRHPRRFPAEVLRESTCG